MLLVSLVIKFSISWVTNKNKILGIGRATSFALVSHGIRQLCILDIDMVSAEKTAQELMNRFPNVEVLLVHTDMANEESIITGINKVVQRFGRIDYAINNAGVGGKLGPSAEILGSEFHSTININLTGLWVCQREEIKQMLKQEPLEYRYIYQFMTCGLVVKNMLTCSSSNTRNRGVIINMSSMLGVVGTTAESPAAAYSAR